MPENIGERIRELRTLAGFSQEELGRRIGVQRAAINKYEKGAVENIPLKTIEQLATVFDVSPIYLVGWSVNNPDNLSMEVKLITGISNFYGKDSVELLELYTNLNPSGKKRVYQYIEDISIVYSKCPGGN